MFRTQRGRYLQRVFARFVSQLQYGVDSDGCFTIKARYDGRPGYTVTAKTTLTEPLDDATMTTITQRIVPVLIAMAHGIPGSVDELRLRPSLFQMVAPDELRDPLFSITVTAPTDPWNVRDNVFHVWGTNPRRPLLVAVESHFDGTRWTTGTVRPRLSYTDEEEFKLPPAAMNTRYQLIDWDRMATSLIEGRPTEAEGMILSDEVTVPMPNPPPSIIRWPQNSGFRGQGPPIRPMLVRRPLPDQRAFDENTNDGGDLDSDDE